MHIHVRALTLSYTITSADPVESSICRQSRYLNSPTPPSASVPAVPAALWELSVVGTTPDELLLLLL